MKCLRKYKWVKLPRMYLPARKGLMGYWAKLASRAAFRKGNAVYCGHTNPVTPGMWSGGVVGLKSILGVKKRAQALCIMEQLQELGYITLQPASHPNSIPTPMSVILSWTAVPEWALAAVRDLLHEPLEAWQPETAPH